MSKNIIQIISFLVAFLVAYLSANYGFYKSKELFQYQSKINSQNSSYVRLCGLKQQYSQYILQYYADKIDMVYWEGQYENYNRLRIYFDKVLVYQNSQLSDRVLLGTCTRELSEAIAQISLSFDNDSSLIIPLLNFARMKEYTLSRPKDVRLLNSTWYRIERTKLTEYIDHNIEVPLNKILDTMRTKIKPVSEKSGDIEIITSKGLFDMNNITFWTIVIAASAIANVFVAIFMWNAMRQTNKLSKEAFRAAKRAWVGISEYVTNVDPQKGKLVISVLVKNFGESPATKLIANVTIKLSGNPVIMNEPKVKVEERILFPSIITTYHAITPSSEIFRSIIDGVSTLEITSDITYETTDNQKRRTIEEATYNPQINKFVGTNGQCI